MGDGLALLSFIKDLLRPKPRVRQFRFSRPLVILQSDDWGRVGVRDREGYEQLRAAGLRLGEHPYDLYTLETAEDVTAVAETLARHRDSTGHSPCLTLNFCVGNPNFTAMRTANFRKLAFLPLANGLPGKWSRPGLLDSYRDGIRKGRFRAGLHGISHFCQTAALNALSENGERAALLRTLWDAETPYIHWRMPWIGFEYWNPERPQSGFLPRQPQQQQIDTACSNFLSLFGNRPASACAPGYRANRNTYSAWAQNGVHIVQCGTGDGLKHPQIEEHGILQIYRTLDFEPSQQDLDVEKYCQLAAACFSHGIPMVISMHAINFHSSLRDFRTPSLAALDELLTALESRHPDLLYLNNEDLYELVTRGTLRGNHLPSVVTSVVAERN